MDPTIALANKVMSEHKAHDQRTGQYLFNILPLHISSLVAGTDFDPFYQDLSYIEIVSWIELHLMYVDDELFGLFNNDQKVMWCSIIPDEELEEYRNGYTSNASPTYEL